MDKIGFVGAYDKTDVILYIAKIISLIGKKVLAEMSILARTKQTPGPYDKEE